MSLVVVAGFLLYQNQKLAQGIKGLVDLQTQKTKEPAPAFPFGDTKPGDDIGIVVSNTDIDSYVFDWRPDVEITKISVSNHDAKETLFSIESKGASILPRPYEPGVIPTGFELIGGTQRSDFPLNTLLKVEFEGKEKGNVIYAYRYFDTRTNK